jgi:transcriptional regulator with XRE-family HTH domain
VVPERLLWGMVTSVTIQGGSDKPPRALRLAQRMDRLGLGNRELARLSGMSRNTIAAARTGASSATTYGKLEKALDDFERETGADQPDESVAVVELADGTRVTFRGVSAEEAARFAAEFLAHRDLHGSA